MFAYCNDNPTNCEDPFGYSVYGILGGTVSGGAGAGISTGVMTLWDSDGNCAIIITGYYGGGTPNVSANLDLFVYSNADNLFEYIYGRSISYGGALFFVSAGGSSGNDSKGDSFWSAGLSLGISALPAELHAGIGYTKLVEIVSYHRKAIPQDVTLDFFSDLPVEIQEMLQAQLGIMPASIPSPTTGRISRQSVSIM